MILYSVVAHPRRVEQAVDLANSIDAMLHVDWNSEGHQANHRRAWAEFPTFADWGVVLEDDAILCPAFEDHIQQELNNLPENMIVSLYMGKSYPIQAQPKYHAAINNRLPLITNNTYHAVGLAIPQRLIRPMLTHTQHLTGPWDEQVTDWVKATNLRVKYTLPSHVDHHDTPSVIPATSWQPRDRPRTAHQFCEG